MFLDIIMGRKTKVGLTLTSETVNILDVLASQTELSRSALIQQLAQAQISLTAESTERIFILSTDESGAVSLVEATPSQKEAETGTDPTEIAALHQEIGTLKAQLAETHSQQSALATQLTEAQQVHASLRTQLMEAQQQQDTLKAELIAARSHTVATVSTAPAPTVAPPLFSDTSDLVSKLQQQLVAAIAANTHLETQYQEQVQAVEKMRQELAQAQQLANIGASQVNRWRFQTFSR
jgi:predicted RNase H-like nuclease (RuvC/YqgF family)